MPALLTFPIRLGKFGNTGNSAVAESFTARGEDLRYGRGIHDLDRVAAAAIGNVI